MVRNCGRQVPSTDRPPAYFKTSQGIVILVSEFLLEAEMVENLYDLETFIVIGALRPPTSGGGRLRIEEIRDDDYQR